MLEYRSTLSQSQNTIPNNNTTPPGPPGPPEIPTTDNNFYPLDELHPASQIYLDISQLTPKQCQAKIRESWDNPDSSPLQGMTEDDLFNAVMLEFLYDLVDEVDLYSLLDDLDVSLKDDLELLEQELQKFTHSTEHYPGDTEIQDRAYPSGSSLDYSLSYYYHTGQLEAADKVFQPSKWPFIRRYNFGSGETTLLKLSSDFLLLIETLLLPFLDSVYCVLRKSTLIFFLQAEVSMYRSIH